MAQLMPLCLLFLTIAISPLQAAEEATTPPGIIKPPISCSTVLCAVPTCPRPIPADPARGKCCPSCPVQKCKPGSIFPAGDGCNKCKCIKNGRVICTRRACRAKYCVVKGKRYRVGETFPADDGCNTCFCTKTGLIACTKIACRPLFCELNGIRYKVGETFPASDGCNTCTCTSTGLIACTEKACLCPVKGQVFTTCGSACPPNCTIPIPICTRQCVARCECPNRTVIDETTNTCVPVSECPPPDCPPDRPIVNCFVDPCKFAKCPAHPDSTCEADYCGGCNARFFDDNGNEVTDSCDCPPTQVFNECGSACTPTCTNPIIPCTLQCVPRCECPRGTLFNEKTKRCVDRSKCPPV